jgi:hypothetical protein
LRFSLAIAPAARTRQTAQTVPRQTFPKRLLIAKETFAESAKTSKIV